MSNLTQLYLGKCFEDLKQYTDPVTAGPAPRDLDKLFLGAQNKLTEGDQEKSYVLYMQYLNHVMANKTHDKITLKKIKVALKRSEQLQDSLKQRYNEIETNRTQKEKEEEEQRQKQIQKEEDMRITKQKTLENKTSYALRDEPVKKKSTSVAVEQEKKINFNPIFGYQIEDVKIQNDIIENTDTPYLFMKPGQMIDIMKEGVESILILDIRPQSQFKRSHLNFDNYINIPESIVNNQQTLNLEHITSTMSEVNQRKFANRKNFAYVIIQDRDLASDNKHINHPSLLVINHFADWLKNFDFSEDAITKKPYVIDGGFKAVLIQYPTYCSVSGSGGGGTGDIGGNRVIINSTDGKMPMEDILFPLLPNEPLAVLSQQKEYSPEESNFYAEYPDVPVIPEMAPYTPAKAAVEFGDVGECVAHETEDFDDDIEQHALYPSSTPSVPDVNRANKPALEEIPPPRPDKTGLEPTPPAVKREGKPGQDQGAPRLRPKPQGAPKPKNQSIIIKGKPGHGLTGLSNLGNTCYMNSIIQCLSNAMPFSVYFINKKFINHINTNNPLGMGGQLAKEFGNLLSAMWCGQYQSIKPTGLKSCIGNFAPRFLGNDQHDSQELLSFLMDGLHEDLNKSTDRSYREEKDLTDLPERQAALESWKNHQRRNDSVIVDLFQGQYKASTMCQNCKFVSLKFEPFMFLTVPLPNKSNLTLRDCLREFKKPEILMGANQWYCPKCKKHQDAVKQLEVWKLPKLLIIHLKRFRIDMYGEVKGKNEINVEFPTENLDLSSFVQASDSPSKFNLNSVSNHHGTLTSGHYTAYCKNVFDNKWRYYDDSSLKPASAHSTQNSGAYVLYYSSINVQGKTA